MAPNARESRQAHIPHLPGKLMLRLQFRAALAALHAAVDLRAALGTAEFVAGFGQCGAGTNHDRVFSVEAQCLAEGNCCKTKQLTVFCPDRNRT
jgi:hypothetical protein